MSTTPQSVLSVIVRRFPRDAEPNVRRTAARIRQAAACQPGFMGTQNSYSEWSGGGELVTVFAFDSRANLEAWEASPLRRDLVSEIDGYALDRPAQAQFDDLAMLLQPGARMSRFETVVVLILWILILNALLRPTADYVLAGALAPQWQGVLLVIVNVTLISYLFLPWTGRMVVALKARLRKRSAR